MGFGIRIHQAARLAVVIAGAAALSGLGCAASPACRNGAKDDIRMAARTSGEAVEAGAKTSVEGVKAAARASGGLIAGGRAEAREKWEEGKQNTRQAANEGAAEVKGEASVPQCR